MLDLNIKKLQDVLIYLDEQRLGIPAVYVSMALDILNEKLLKEKRDLGDETIRPGSYGNV